MPMIMQSLQPVKVNWSIDYSTPFLFLTALENDCVEISFNADFGRHVKSDTNQEESRLIKSQEVVVAQHPTSLVEEDFSQYQYQKLQVRFDTFYAVKMSSSHDSLSVINYKDYDWSSVMFFDLLCEDSKIWSEKFHSYWKEKNICPDPRMYEVGHSRWLDETKASRFGCKHFIFLGHDNYIEVLAKDWHWLSSGGIRNW
jgi:hypothetical protein